MEETKNSNPILVYFVVSFIMRHDNETTYGKPGKKLYRRVPFTFLEPMDWWQRWVLFKHPLNIKKMLIDRDLVLSDGEMVNWRILDDPWDRDWI